MASSRFACMCIWVAFLVAIPVGWFVTVASISPALRTALEGAQVGVLPLAALRVNQEVPCNVCSIPRICLLESTYLSGWLRCVGGRLPPFLITPQHQLHSGVCPTLSFHSTAALAFVAAAVQLAHAPIATGLRIATFRASFAVPSQLISPGTLTYHP
jgi:hypothetical protein